MTLQTLTDTGKQAAKEHGGWIAILLVILGGYYDHQRTKDAMALERQHYEDLQKLSERRWTGQRAVNDFFHGSNTVARIETNAIKQVEKENK